ncbi:MAG: hypothetical protein CL610_11525 [Anaerolineaceae bacterium]|nr:hypothetical protein [Anaerolineaceae bacterium]
MGQRPFLLLLLVLLAACTSDPAINARPRLVGEATLNPTAVMPTRIATSTPVVIPVVTSESISPLEVGTIEGSIPDFVLITPTLPPSKTPTPTATISPTPTRTPPPTRTVPPPLFPTYVVATPGVVGPAVNPVVNNQACTSGWFFAQPVVTSTCPFNEALSSAAAYQQYQQGFMIWVGQQDSIYTVYDSAEQPRWQVFKDDYEDGMMEIDHALSMLAPPYTWQPRRGFGLIWRENPTVRERLGWAVREWEEPYDARVQIGADGSIFLAEPRGGIIALQPGGRDWDRYTGS